MLVKQFHYIKKNLKWFLSQSIYKAQSIVLLMLDAGLNFRSLQHKKFLFKIEISQSNQPKKEEQNTYELFQYQTDFIKLLRIFKKE
jgi:hypothetical protein